MKILVDADACPVKEEIYRVARRYNIPVILVTNASMWIPSDEGISLQIVPGGFDAADDWIVDNAGPTDIVITADIPLASRSVEKGARTIAPTGRVFTEDNVGDGLALRNLLTDLRSAGSITGGPAPFAKKDRSRFLQSLDKAVQDIRRA
jgi:uncharacterized protein